MKIWIVVENGGREEGYSLPSAGFSNKEAAEAYREQKGRQFEIEEYEILDHCPEPRIEQTYQDINFGLFTPPQHGVLLPKELARIPHFYLIDLLDKLLGITSVQADTFSWSIMDRKKTRWQRFKKYIGL